MSSIKQKLKLLEQQFDKDNSFLNGIETQKTAQKVIKSEKKKQMMKTASNSTKKQDKNTDNNSSLKANLFNVQKNVSLLNKQDDFQWFIDNMNQNLIKDAKKWKNQVNKSKKLKKQFTKCKENELLLKIKQFNKSFDQEFIEQFQSQIEQLQDNNQQLMKDLKAPSKPLGPYILFLKQRRYKQKQQKLKLLQTNPRLPALTSQSKPAQLWQKLAIAQKDKYYLQYESRLHKYNILSEEYKLYSGKKKALSAYSRFYKKMYGILEVQGKNDIKEITKIISQQWVHLSALQKQQYQNEQIDQKFDLQEKRSNLQEKIKAYQVKLQQYQKEQKMYDLDKNLTILGKEKELKKRVQDQKRLMKIQKQQQKQIQRKARQIAEKKRAQQIQRKLKQLKEQQIMKLKLQNYKINGYPKSYLSTLQKSEPPKNELIQKKQSVSTTTLTQSKFNVKQSQNSMEIEQQQCQSNLAESYSIQLQDKEKIFSSELDKHNKEIKKKSEQQKDLDKVQKKPGASVFKKIIEQMQIIYGND